MFIIFTDGLENSSKEYSKNQIKEMIKHQEDVYKWEFLYLGAHVDAFSEASLLGIKVSNTAQFNKTDEDFVKNYAFASCFTSSYANQNSGD